MTQTLYWYLLVIFLVLFISVFVSNKIVPIKQQNVKYPEIDGIRGYLAFFVFLHHSYIWYYFLHINEWKEPNSNLFNHFGQTSVSIFFMITAFLFVTKLLKLKEKTMDWKKYIQSRLLRLIPAYLFSILILFTTVIILSNFKKTDSFIKIIVDCMSWIFFTVAGPNNINSIENTYLINAGVTWSLPYEWMFYFLLPLIALFLKIRVSLKTSIIFSTFFIAIALLNHASLKQFLPFFGGILTAFILEKNKKITFLKNSKFSILGIVLILVLIQFFHSAKNILPLLITTFLFILIASGNSFFGLLSAILSRNFGQITYSLYLLHGIVLFVVFRFIIGYESAAKFSELQHWSVIGICVFPIILISQISYKFIELPFINLHKIKS